MDRERDKGEEGGVRAYLNNLWLWLRGIPWLWTRACGVALKDVSLLTTRKSHELIFYKPGWGPWKFLIPYLTTYLAGTLAGYGVVSLSRAWYERSDLMTLWSGSLPHKRMELCGPDGCKRAYPFAHFMTRLLNWLVPGKHGVNAGGILWGSKCLRRMS